MEQLSQEDKRFLHWAAILGAVAWGRDPFFAVWVIEMEAFVKISLQAGEGNPILNGSV